MTNISDHKSSIQTIPQPKQTIELLDLSPDLLIGIFFTGYLGYDYSTIFKLSRVNKYIQQLAYDHVPVLYINKPLTIPQQIQVYQSFTKLIAYDLSYLPMQSDHLKTSDALYASLLAFVTQESRGRFIQALVLRQTNLMEIHQTIQPLPNLKMLDLTEVQSEDLLLTASYEASLITFDSFIIPHTKLMWLNLSKTLISMKSIEIINEHLLSLQTLILHQCSGITNDLFRHLTNLSLKEIDISNCLNISHRILRPLVENK